MYVCIGQVSLRRANTPSFRLSLRRVAFRALSLPSTSVSLKSRSITTINRSTTVRPLRISFLVQRRFASEDVARSELEAEERDTSDAPESAHDDEQSTFASTISSTTQGVTERASDAAEGVAQAMGRARDTVTHTAEAAAGGLGFGSDRDSEPAPPVKTLYVGNLFFDVTAEDLKKEMERFGTVTDIRIVLDNRGLSKGFGYVDFETEEQATLAQESMNQAVFEGRRMTVQFTRGTKEREREAPRNPPSKTLFIGNMSFDMTDQDLNDMFRTIKNVVDVRVAIDRRTGQPRGFAHADFVDVASAEKAYEELRGKEVYGRKLRLDYSSSKLNTLRSPRGQRQGGDASMY